MSTYDGYPAQGSQAGLSSLTPWTEDIDAATFDLFNITEIRLVGGHTIGDNPSGLIIDAGLAADEVLLQTGGVTRLSVGQNFITAELAMTMNGFEIEGVTFIQTDNATEAAAGFLRLAAIDRLGWAAPVGAFDFSFGVDQTETVDKFTWEIDSVIELELSATGLNIDAKFMDIGEIATPANPSANVGRLYVKDVAAVTTLFFRDPAGTETDLLAAGAGANTALSNLAATAVNVTIDMNGNALDNVLTLTDNSANPADAGTIRLGNVEIISWRNAANNGNIDFTVNASNQFVFAGGALATFTMAGTLDLNAQTLDNAAIINSNAANLPSVGVLRLGNAEVIAWDSDPTGVNVTLGVDIGEELTLTMINDTAVFKMVGDHTVPANGTLVSTIRMMDDDSAGTQRPYATIRTEIEDPTAASRDGLILFQVAEAQTDNSITNYFGLNVNGDNNIRCFRSLLIDDARDIILNTTTGTALATAVGQKLAFWGATPVVQQSVGADTLANLYTLLRTLGIVA